MLDIEWRTRRADVGALDAGPPSLRAGPMCRGGRGNRLGGDLEETMETSDGRWMSRDVVEGSSERWVNGEW
jgi:hypothetical protein